MMAEIYKQRRSNLGRNRRIWLARVDGCTYAEIAEAFDLSVQRVDQIIKQVVAEMPADEREAVVQIRGEVHDRVKTMLFDMALMDPSPSFAPNGKPHYDPKTGEPVYDYSLRLNAIDRLLKLDERIGKLTGTESPVQHTHTVTQEAQQATLDAAAKISLQFAGLIPPSPEVVAHARGNG
jgi:hypothetical protein